MCVAVADCAVHLLAVQGTFATTCCRSSLGTRLHGHRAAPHRAASHCNAPCRAALHRTALRCKRCAPAPGIDALLACLAGEGGQGPWLASCSYRSMARRAACCVFQRLPVCVWHGMAHWLRQACCPLRQAPCGPLVELHRCVVCLGLQRGAVPGSTSASPLRCSCSCTRGSIGTSDVDLIQPNWMRLPSQLAAMHNQTRLYKVIGGHA